MLLLLLVGDSDRNGEVVECSLKVSHLVVAHSPEVEGLAHLPILVASLREHFECFLDMMFALLCLAALLDGLPGPVKEGLGLEAEGPGVVLELLLGGYIGANGLGSLCVGGTHFKYIFFNF